MARADYRLMTVAGESTRRQYDKLRKAERQRALSRLPITIPFTLVAAGAAYLGGEALAPGTGWLLAGISAVGLTISFWDLPQHIKAHGSGSEGEVMTGRVLTKLERYGYFAIHDRCVPGRRENIDHIAVGPAGVFIIESKRTVGKVKTRGGVLFVNGRNKHDQFITQTWKQAVAIQSVLSPYLVPLRMDVKPIICIHAEEIDDPGVVLEGVRIVGPRTLRKTLKKARPRLNEDQVSKMAQALDALLKPA